MYIFGPVVTKPVRFHAMSCNKRLTYCTIPTSANLRVVERETVFSERSQVKLDLVPDAEKEVVKAHLRGHIEMYIVHLVQLSSPGVTVSDSTINKTCFCLLQMNVI
jgi:hypothetical protein